MRFFTAFLLIIGLTSACAPNTPAPTPTATTPALVGSVDIQYPQDGSTIYSELLVVSGTGEGLPGDQFRLVLAGADDSIIAQNTVVVDSDSPWQIEIPHGYSGDPMEVSILALPLDENTAADYDAVQVVISAQANRPQGTFGSITSPAEGANISAGAIEVSGLASGVFENTFTLDLLDNSGTMLNRQIITLNNPYFIDEVPWAATVLTGEYRGAATLKAYTNSAQDGSEIDLGSVNITIN
jgi:hypothetical protein